MVKLVRSSSNSILESSPLSSKLLAASLVDFSETPVLLVVELKVAKTEVVLTDVNLLEVLVKSAEDSVVEVIALIGVLEIVSTGN